jgi:hypothetical protein
MAPSELALPALTVTGSIAGVAVVLRYGLDAILRFIVGVIAILARDERSRAERALDVLNALRRDR